MVILSVELNETLIEILPDLINFLQEHNLLDRENN